MTPADGFADPTIAANQPRLIAFLAESLGRPVDAVTTPTLITAGAGMQNRNYACSVRAGGEVMECVLRCRPAHVMAWRLDWDFYNIEREWRLLRELPALRLSVPTPITYGMSDALGTAGFAMARLPGEPMGHTPDATLLPAYARLAAEVSMIPAEANSWMAANLPLRTNERLVAWVEDKSRDLDRDPLRRYALDWLREHRPPSGPLVVAHGDPNPGNILVADGRITGIVDWEFACLTDDPLAALMRVTWIYHSEAVRPVFCQAMGRSVDDLTWHIALGLFRELYLNRHGDRAARHAELAALVGYAALSR
jgi:aminoglycoside phosphotransferase (APT) family kinase protein